MTRFLIIILSFAAQSYGVTWYVTPQGSGAKNGTSYENSWCSLSNVVWGAAGVSAGDTLYVCGPHVFFMTNYVGINDSGYSCNTQAIVTVGASGWTMRMDYPTDTGLIFGGAVDAYNTNRWYGPDANSIYWRTNRSSYFVTRFTWDGSLNLTRLSSKTNSTWTFDSSGGCYFDTVPSVNYIQLPDGSDPNNTNVCLPYLGWKFDFGSQSNITLLNCHFVGELFGFFKPNYSEGFSGLKWLTINGGTFLEGCPIVLFPGNDFWTISGCEIAKGKYGLYSFSDGQNRGAWNLTVTNCYIHDCDTVNYQDTDGHGIGIQGQCNSTIVRNRIERTGSGIEYWTGSNAMTNNTIARNFIKDIHAISGGTAGHGIVISGDTGDRTGFKIYGNIVVSAGTNATETYQGTGIRCNNPEYIEIFNNTILGCHYGISFGSATSHGIAENNIIVNCDHNYVSISGQTSPGDCVSDYNVYWTQNIPDYVSGTHDVHSITNDPLFIVSNPSASTDFRLKPSSPAINSGTNVGLPYCQSAPDIGAIEFCNQMLLNTLKANNVRISP